MNANQSTLSGNVNTNKARLYTAFELADKKWKLVFSDGDMNRIRYKNIEAGVLPQMHDAIDSARSFFKLPDDCEIYSCFEAGRDGFWLHRYLTENGINNKVVDSSSIEVPRRKRKAKTDKIDARKLLMMLIRYHVGDCGIWSVVNVPPEYIEDLRRINRELDRLRKEQTMHTNRIGSQLVRFNIRDVAINRNFPKLLETLTDWNGRKLPPHLKDELSREYERWAFVHQQILELERKRKKMVAEGKGREMEQVRRFMLLCGLGIEASWLFAVELFSWRNFNNRKEVGGFLGLCSMPFDSGDSKRDQGISKAGPRRIRAMANQISWLWMRHQPASKQTQWFNERFAGGGKRMRKVGIVGVSRRLMIELWHYIEHGVVPEGAKMKAA